MEIRTEPLPWKHKNLLLLGDEDEKMIARYLDRGTMYVLDEDGVKAGIVLTEEVFVLPDGRSRTLPFCPSFRGADLGARSSSSHAKNTAAAARGCTSAREKARSPFLSIGSAGLSFPTASPIFLRNITPAPS